jgi:hypothetical protein
MAAPTGVYVLRNAIVEVDGVEYANQVISSRLVPDTAIQTVKTLVPDGVIQDVDTPTWTWEVTAVQKNNTGGLVRALRGLAIGEIVVVEMAPTNATGEDKATFSIVSLQPPFGGQQGEFAQVELTFPVVGQPEFAPIV